MGKDRRDARTERTVFLISESGSEESVETQREEREAASSTLRVDLGVSASEVCASVTVGGQQGERWG